MATLLSWLALAPGWKSGEGLTLLTENGVKWVDTGLGWWSDSGLDVHHLVPSGINLNTTLDPLGGGGPVSNLEYESNKKRRILLTLFT